MAGQDNQNKNNELQKAVDTDTNGLNEKKGASAASIRSVEFLFDIPLELTVEIGRASMPMGELINIMPGDIIELNTPAGDKISILANGKLVAKGEAVLVGERYGVRILEIIENDPFKRVLQKPDGGVA